ERERETGDTHDDAGAEGSAVGGAGRDDDPAHRDAGSHDDGADQTGARGTRPDADGISDDRRLHGRRHRRRLPDLVLEQRQERSAAVVEERPERDQGRQRQAVSAVRTRVRRIARGQAATETIIMMTFLLLMIFGLVHLCMLMTVKYMVNFSAF